MDLLDDPVKHALEGNHRSLAWRHGRACCYPGDIAPFASIDGRDAASLEDLRLLLAPGKAVYLTGEPPAPGPGLRLEATLACLQMVMPVPAAATIALSLPETSAAPAMDATSQAAAPIARLDAGDAPAMVALTTLAFPGFFRARTYIMGSYFGVHVDGVLVAMAGERLSIGPCREISGVCTDPEHTGQGHAARLVLHLVREHYAAGLRSCLHVSAENTRAIALYRRLGFAVRRELPMHRVARRD